MNNIEISNKVKKFLSIVLDVSPESISDDSTKQNTEKWDSLGHINLITMLEQSFGILFDETKIAKLTSVKFLTEYISVILLPAIERGDEARKLSPLE